MFKYIQYSPSTIYLTFLLLGSLLLFKSKLIGFHPQGFHFFPKELMSITACIFEMLFLSLHLKDNLGGVKFVSPTFFLLSSF